VPDDDLEEHLDPELDPVEQSGGESLPGPFSLSQLVVGVHALGAGAVLPFLWLAYQEGNLPLVGSLGLIVVLLLTAGVAAGRVTARRFGE
jgi:hypothetical protein